ncbi:MAG: hypothetical protein ACOY45_01320 [Pseudomonadota bacterium]
MAGHTAGTAHHRNQGLDFSTCHHCGCDLIRAEQEWVEVPRGFRVVWREFGRSDDAASVADRMRRMAPPPPRRDQRNARPAPRRDPRGRPFFGKAGILGTLANLRALLTDERPDTEVMEASGQYVIRLPSAGASG